MIFFMQIGVTQLKKIVVRFTGLNNYFKESQCLEYVNYVTYLQNPVTLIHGNLLNFVTTLKATIQPTYEVNITYVN